MFFFFQAEDGIRDSSVTGFRRVLFRSKAIQKLNNQAKYLKKYPFLKDAALHIAALMNSASLETKARPVNLDKSEELEALYETVISALSELVQERAKREKDKYEHRRTFKDIETFGRAQQF